MWEGIVESKEDRCPGKSAKSLRRRFDRGVGRAQSEDKVLKNRVVPPGVMSLIEEDRTRVEYVV